MSETSKAILTKVLAILGFCVTIALIIWLIITLIGKAPGAFSSLAGVANSINLHKELSALAVTTDKKVANSGEPFELSWTDTKHPGTYQVGYACTEGMLVLFKNTDGTLHPLRCGDEMLPLPAEVTKLSLVASSTKDRFTDVNFTVRFSDATSTKPLEGSVKVTVVNASIPVGGLLQNATSTPGATTNPNASTTNPTGEDTHTTKPSPKPGTGTTVPPVQHTVPHYVYPQSNPNGYTDLAVTIKNATAVGNYTAYTVTFMIKNIGTKTSNAWSFYANLPDGNDYTSMQYAGLKPQEYMIFTMSIPLPGYTFAIPKATYTVSVANDTNLSNNTASTASY